MRRGRVAIIFSIAVVLLASALSHSSNFKEHTLFDPADYGYEDAEIFKINEVGDIVGVLRTTMNMNAKLFFISGADNLEVEPEICLLDTGESSNFFLRTNDIHLSELGSVIGNYREGSHLMGFAWSKEGGFEKLESSSLGVLRVSSINDGGTAVGTLYRMGTVSKGRYVYTTMVPYSGGVWDSEGGLRMVPGTQTLIAVNNLGEMVGTRHYDPPGIENRGNLYEAVFVEYEGAEPQPLGEPENVTVHHSVPLGINDAGEVLVHIDIYITSRYRTSGNFVWSAEGGDYYARVPLFASPFINELGQVAGRHRPYSNYYGHYASVVWSPPGTLGTLFAINKEGPMITDLNDLGQAVGYSDVKDSLFPSAIFWSEETGLVKLSSMGKGNFSMANDINNSGVIVGSTGSKNDKKGTDPCLWLPGK